MSIVLDRLTKSYGVQLVVDRVSLEVADGELFVLLGPSGSGKSTLLRMVAGLLQPDGGRVLLHGQDVTGWPPQQRGTGFVFQNYSIFRHMNVSENVQFGLKIRKVPAAERARRREQLLDLVGLVGLGSRYGDQLSGGQQQRVALARALAYEPNVLLLDEPFGALDVKTRSQLRRSLKEIQQRLRVTTILVTHDQEEAFELADRIGVIERGRLLEVGPTEMLYSRPRTLFTATFLGTGTVLVGRAEGGRARFGSLSLPIPAEVPHEEGARVQMLFRPEEVNLSQEPPQAAMPTLGQGSLIEQSFAGAFRRVRVRLPHLPGTRQIAPFVPFGEEGLLVDAVLPPSVPTESGEPWVSLRAWHILEQPHFRLLVCDSGVGSTGALAMTSVLVDELRASATVLAVTEKEEEAEPRRAALHTRLLQQGLPPAEIRVHHGNAAEQILGEQAATLYEMLVMAASDDPHGRPDRLGANLLKVLERVDVPVLVVKGPRRSLRRLLICTAAGEPGKADVRMGGRLARRLGAAVTLLYVTDPTGEPGPLVQAHLDRAVATLRALDVESQVRVCACSTPAQGILAEPRTGDHDLIVIGSHGPESRSILGLDDVTLQVLRGADRPVLVVPGEET